MARFIKVNSSQNLFLYLYRFSFFPVLVKKQEKKKSPHQAHTEP